MKTHLFVGLLALTLAAAPARAEELTTVDQVLSRIASAQSSHRDLSLQLKGYLVQGPKRLQGEMELKAIPSLDLRRITFKAPTQMAGNVVVIEKERAARYLSLTHQVVVSSVQEAAKGAPLDFSRISALMGGKGAEQGFRLVGVDRAEEGKRYVLESPMGGNRLKVWVREAEWRVHRLEVLNGFGQVVAEWTVTQYATDQGLSPEVVRALPADAEVLKR
jgi:outer membrane lipoprotein-sorting protein